MLFHLKYIHQVIQSARVPNVDATRSTLSTRFPRALIECYRHGYRATLCHTNNIQNIKPKCRTRDEWDDPRDAHHVTLASNRAPYLRVNHRVELRCHPFLYGNLEGFHQVLPLLYYSLQLRVCYLLRLNHVTGRVVCKGLAFEHLWMQTSTVHKRQDCVSQHLLMPSLHP